ncbi:MAG: aldo/keto reductase [Fibrobacterales bacterium]
MQYNRLGTSGLQVSELSFGSWVTFHDQLGIAEAKKCMHAAFEAGVNFFDNAEAYAGGKAEVVMGEALKEFNRDELVISTKIFWGGKKPNQEGLSRKHIIEGTQNALKRFDLDYVDLLYCHRPDPHTPIEETVRAMNWCIEKGYAFYWGTSEWTAKEIQEAIDICDRLGLIRPTMEQPQYNMLVRDKVEREFAPLYAKYGLGTTIWSPLASGVLTGKYNDGIPKDSRLAQVDWLRDMFQNEGGFLSGDEVILKIKKITEIAQDLGCSTAQLALAWCLKNPHVSTVITGASRIEQVTENMKAIEIKKSLTEELMTTIDEILGNKPDMSAEW